MANSYTITAGQHKVSFLAAQRIYSPSEPRSSDLNCLSIPSGYCRFVGGQKPLTKIVPFVPASLESDESELFESDDSLESDESELLESEESLLDESGLESEESLLDESELLDSEDSLESEGSLLQESEESLLEKSELLESEDAFESEESLLVESELLELNSGIVRFLEGELWQRKSAVFYTAK